MKAEELMKGNWVFSKRFQRPVQIVTVASKVSYYVDGILRTEKVGDVSPIPLSPEILEKNGFAHKDFYSELKIDEKLRVLCDTNHVAVIHGDHADLDRPIYYLHELQNALTLCRIEKEITL